MEITFCTVGMSDCTIEMSRCTVEISDCTIEVSRCTMGMSDCTVEISGCTVEMANCTMQGSGRAAASKEKTRGASPLVRVCDADERGSLDDALPVGRLEAVRPVAAFRHGSCNLPSFPRCRCVISSVFYFP